MNERHNSAPSMPRRARLSVAGVPWHIIQRGNNRAACFHAEEDYRRYLDDLAEQSRRFGCAIHAYVLMTNHVHLLLTPQKTDSAGWIGISNAPFRQAGRYHSANERSNTESFLQTLPSARFLGPHFAALGPLRRARPERDPWRRFRCDAGRDSGCLEQIVSPRR